MSAAARTAAESPGRPAPAPRAMMRRGSLAVLILTVLEYGIGMYVNLYLAVPGADRDHGLGPAIANGPALLSVHAVVGLLLGLGALAVLAQAIRTRGPAVIVFSAAGLFALAVASVLGASFTSTGAAADSMGMSVLTGVALLCYALILYGPRQEPPAPQPHG